nr:hypothetical protein [uncultured Rhodopila sp.]
MNGRLGNQGCGRRKEPGVDPVPLDDIADGGDQRADIPHVAPGPDRAVLIDVAGRDIHRVFAVRQTQLCRSALVSLLARAIKSFAPGTTGSTQSAALNSSTDPVIALGRYVVQPLQQHR